MNEDLDIGIGRDLMSNLCDNCRIRLERRIKPWHVMSATVTGPGRIANIIDKTCCDDCKAKIWQEGVRYGK